MAFTDSRHVVPLRWHARKAAWENQDIENDTLTLRGTHESVGNPMKTLLIFSALVATVLFSACESDHDEYGDGYGYGREYRAPAVGAATGLSGHSPHSGNSDGSRTDLR